MIIGITPYSSGVWLGVRDKFAFSGEDPRMYASLIGEWDVCVRPDAVGDGSRPTSRPKE